MAIFLTSVSVAASGGKRDTSAYREQMLAVAYAIRMSGKRVFSLT